MIRPTLIMFALTVPAAAQTASQRDVRDFVETCRSDSIRAAICLSYIQGFKDGIASAEKFCVPPKVLFGDQVAAFVNWADTHKASLKGPKQAELLKFFEETYPCSK